METGTLQKCTCSDKGRNLVICIDGTANKFGKRNTNVVEFYSKVVKTPKQLTYYNSGIGTYTRSSRQSWWTTTMELTLGLNIDRIILAAYRWLSENYMEDDRIYLFGFSRGAYQVGLIHKGNEEQIPFAYEVYTDPRSHSKEAAIRFKDIFSREGVRVHFVGVWDTVSAVRGRLLPLTNTAKHICFFRHALALDERRFHFLPDYVQTQAEPKSGDSQHVKEVWFAGTHSSVAGKNRSAKSDAGDKSLLWMTFEALSYGLNIDHSKVEWSLKKMGDWKESRTWKYVILEFWPCRPPSYREGTTTTRRWHRGRGREIQPGQKIHASVAFREESYEPKAKLDQLGKNLNWKDIVGSGNVEKISEWICPRLWKTAIELDIFHFSEIRSEIQVCIERLKSELEDQEASMWRYRLSVAASSKEGRAVLVQRSDFAIDFVQIFKIGEDQIRVCIAKILLDIYADLQRDTNEVKRLISIARDHDILDVQILAIKLLAHSLSGNSLSELEPFATESGLDFITHALTCLLKVDSGGHNQAVQNAVFDEETEDVIVDMLGSVSDHVRELAVKLFIDATKSNGDILKSKEPVGILCQRIADQSPRIKTLVVSFFTNSVSDKRLENEIITPETIAMVHQNIRDEDDADFRVAAIKFLIAAAPQDPKTMTIFRECLTRPNLVFWASMYEYMSTVY